MLFLDITDKYIVITLLDRLEDSLLILSLTWYT
jgi:hypothetical protein